MKEEIRAAVIAAALLVAGFLSWMMDELADCRDYRQRSFASSAILLLKSGCSKTGSHNLNQIAMPSGVVPSRIAQQQKAISP